MSSDYSRRRNKKAQEKLDSKERLSDKTRVTDIQEKSTMEETLQTSNIPPESKPATTSLNHAVSTELMTTEVPRNNGGRPPKNGEPTTFTFLRNQNHSLMR